MHICMSMCSCVCVCIRMEVVLSIQVGAGVINTREAPKRNTPNVAPSSLSIAPITMVYRWYIYNSIVNGVYKPIYILVGGWPTILQNDGVRQLGRMTSHMKWKIKFMFETTNQRVYRKFTKTLKRQCKYDHCHSHESPHLSVTRLKGNIADQVAAISKVLSTQTAHKP